MIDENVAKETIEYELDAGETISWIGKPSIKRMMVPSLFTFGFGVVWMSFNINFVYMWYHGQNNVQGPGGFFGMQGVLSSIFFIPFMTIGVGALLSPVWFYLRAKKTFYGVTDRRTLIVNKGRSRTVQSWVPKNISEIQRTERSDGSGDLTFGRRISNDSDSPGPPLLQFVGIKDVRSVEKIVLALIENRENTT